jgi:hypothetical protein
MSLTETFNAFEAKKVSPHAIQVVSGNFCYHYDFALRQQLAWFSPTGSQGWQPFGNAPFSQLDREVLELARNKLIDLGGSPPELPAAQQPDPPKAKGLNL